MASPDRPRSSFKYMCVAFACATVILGAASGWLILQNQGLSSDLQTLNTRYDSLNSTNEELQQDYESLFLEFSNLNSNYGGLQSDYGLLRRQYEAAAANYSALGDSYSSLKAHYAELSADVLALDQLLDSVALFPEAIGRVLTDEQIRAVDWAVEHAIGGEDDPWEIEKLIFGFINSTIDYAGDVVLPYISETRSTVVGGSEYLTGFDFDYSPDYVNTPALTLLNGYGDCDDQAVLGYAMLKYYERHVDQQEYDLYLALITFKNSAMHLCVIRPATDGFAFVFDPAGGYLSPDYGSPAAPKALQQLSAYSDYWIGNGGIGTISLYSVIDYEGNYALAANGTLADIASFLS
jgi:outer membrane murein-binding lipoprotein Lpp